MTNKKKNDTSYVKQLIIKASQKYGVNPYLALGLARQESGFGHYDRKGNTKKSSAGALGVFQLMPSTAKGLKINPHNLEENIDGGVRYLKAKLDEFKGDTRKALAAYNAGSGAVRKYGGVPPYKETQNYVKSIMSSMDKVRQQPDVRNLIATDYNINNSNIAVTGAASNMQQNIPIPNFNSPYVTAADLQRARQSLVTNPQLQAFASQAGAGDQRTQLINQLMTSYLNGGRSYQDTIQALASLGVPEQQLRSIPVLDNTVDTQRNLNLYNRYAGATPEQQQAAQAQQFQALQQLQAGMNGGRNMYDMLNQLYDQYRQTAQMPTGYQVSPEELQREINANYFNAVLNKQYDKVLSPTQIAQMKYQNQVANQAGVPYDVYLQQKQNELAIAKQQLEDVLKAQAQYGTVDAKTLEAYNNVINAGKDIDKQRQIDVKDLIKQGMVGQQDVAKQSMQNAGNVATTGMTTGANMYGDLMSGITNLWGQSSDLERAQIAARLGLTTDQMDNQVKAYQADVAAATGVRGQDVSRQTELDKIQANAPKNAAQAAYYGSGALLNQAAANPTVNTTNAAMTLPTNVRSSLINPNLTSEQYQQIMGQDQARQQASQNDLLQRALNMFNRPQQNQQGVQ